VDDHTDGLLLEDDDDDDDEAESSMVFEFDVRVLVCFLCSRPSTFCTVAEGELALSDIIVFQPYYGSL
jgi:hypothetical protein